jgi:protocatechuate 3,4-dioxygenase beta subunit
MRKTIGICVWMALGIWTASGLAMTITGEVVDNRARPIPEAEVAMCERYGLDGSDEDARIISPVVKTDAEGRFTLEADVTRQRSAFIAARKPGLAHGWEWLNCSNNTLGRKHFPLVLEPAGVLAGQVVDPNGRPVARAEVQATPVVTSGFSAVNDRWYVPGPRAWFAVTTDTQGRFRFEQFSADTTAGLRVQVPGGEPRYAFRLHSMESCGFVVGRTDLRIMLPRAGTIQGRVLDGQGRPVGGVDLTIRNSPPREDINSLYFGRKTTSDSRGVFAFSGIPEGPHEISILAPEQGPAPWIGMETKASVKAGQAAEATVRVSHGGVLEVTALDARTRRPVPGARLEAVSQQSRGFQFALADAKGVARVRLLAGSYTAYVFAAGFSRCQSTVKVADGQTIRREALLPASSRVSGRVLDSGGQPAGDVMVTLHPFGDHVYTDARGRFDAERDEQYGAKSGWLLARDVKKGLVAMMSIGGSSGPVDLTLTSAWTLTGQIADPNGTAIPAARVSLSLSLPGTVSSMGVEALSDPAGRFEIKAIPPVQKGFSYIISANAAGYGPAQHLKIFPQGPAGTSVDLGTIRLPWADASVSGIVVDAKGAPAAGVPVFAGDYRQSPQPRRSTATNEKGEFSLTRLCTGPGSLQASFPSSPGGAGFLKTCFPVRNVKIVIGKDVTDPMRPSSGSGTPPQLTDLCPYLQGAQTDGIPLLLCLVDAQQPSSQQCLADLAKKAGALRDKGLLVIAVQTVRMGSQQDYGLLNANRTTLPWCGILDDFEPLKTAWGIKSLPWLILTDKKHGVAAAGFSPGELDRKVEEAFSP